MRVLGVVVAALAVVGSVAASDSDLLAVKARYLPPAQVPFAARVARPEGSTDAALAGRLAAIGRSYPGWAGFWIHDLRTGRTAGWNSDARFPAGLRRKARAARRRNALSGARLRRGAGRPLVVEPRCKPHLRAARVAADRRCAGPARHVVQHVPGAVPRRNERRARCSQAAAYDAPAGDDGARSRP